ncbi:MAG TPA: PAS domain S-box protein [Ktedonobacteraceae bacterium]|nr:PAS domain S-box protein [Ktedonobacteraceae bacterium]
MSDALQRSKTDASLSSQSMHITSAALTQLLEVSPDALVVVDSTGTIVVVNAQLEELFGYSHGELEGQPLEVLLPARFREMHVGHRNRYVAAPRTRPMGAGLQLFGLRKDGIEFPVDISLRPLSVEGVPHVIGAVRDVSEQKRAERERAQQLQQIRLQNELINLSHDAILMRDPINRVLSWNRGAEELYGYTEQQALGRITHILLKTRFPANRAEVERILEQEGQWEGELMHARSDGSTVIVESRHVLVRDEQNQPIAVLEIDRDITQRRRREQAEQAAHAEAVARLDLLQQVLDALPGSVYLVYGPEARLALANRSAASVWGAQWQVHQPMLEFLSSHGIMIFDTQGRPLPPEKFATMRAVQKGEMTLQHQETIRRPDGSSLPVLVNALALPFSRSLTYIQKDAEMGAAGSQLALVMHQDVTALKEAEYLKDEFVGIAAHELRAPLAVLKGYADMLIVQSARQHGPELADWQREALEEIKEATARLVALSEDLLEVTRLQAGRLILQRAPTNIVSLAQRVAASLQKTTTRHLVEVHSSRPVMVADIDPGRTEQILINLIGNAIKYSPQGGPITINLWEGEGTPIVHLSVQDHGIGIPAHQQGQIFGRFVRAENAQSRGIGGTGLGLYLSRALVEQHGGQLWFESEESKGSTFFLTLPLAANQE